MARVRLPAIQVATFTRQFHVLISSGVTIPRALEVLTEQTDHPASAEVYYSLSRLISEGRYLSAALQKFPSTFGAMYLGLIRVGEQTGNLLESTGLLADWLERDHEVKSRVRAAMVYPAIVIVLASLASLGLMHVLGPIFLQMFADDGRPLPWPTRVVAQLVYVQKQPWFWLSLLAAAILIWRLVAAWSLNPHWRLRAWNLLSSMPALGPLLGAAVWSRYCAALSILQHCGVAPQRAYHFAAQVGGDPRLIIDSALLIQAIVEGETASSYMEKKPRLYPGLISAGLSVSEDTGGSKPILDHLGRFYREDLEVRIQILQSLIEPALLLATSCVLLFLILSLMLPLYGQMQEVA